MRPAARRQQGLEGGHLLRVHRHRGQVGVAQGLVEPAVVAGCQYVRVYHFAGTQHIMGATMPPGVCALPPNTVDPRPFLRAQFVAMDRWVRDETAPPPFAHPRLVDRTLVPMRT